MTEQTGDVLADIDAAMEGWHGWDPAVSDDAMRWAPEVPARADDGLLELFQRYLAGHLAEPGTRGHRIDWVVLDEPLRLHTTSDATSVTYRRPGHPSPIDAIVADALARSVAEQAGRIFGIPPHLLG